MKEEKDKIKEQYRIEKENEETINAEIKEIMRHCNDEKFLLDFMQKIRDYRTRVYDLKKSLEDDVTKAYQAKNSELLEEMKARLEKVKGVETNEHLSDWIVSAREMRARCKFAINGKIYPIQSMICNCFLNNVGAQAWCNENKERIKTCDDKWSEDIDGYNMKIAGGYNIQGIRWNVYSVVCAYKNGAHHLNEEDIRRVASGNSVIVIEGNVNKELKKMEEEAIQRVNILKSTDIFQYYEQEIEFWQEKNLEKNLEESDNEQYYE